jgi:hypothetical protein
MSYLNHVFTHDGRSYVRRLQPQLGIVGANVLYLEAPAVGVGWRKVTADVSLDPHPAPWRNLVVGLSGLHKLACPDGDEVTMAPGDVLLADDMTGVGHSLHSAAGSELLSVHLGPGFVLDSWATAAE